MKHKKIIIVGSVIIIVLFVLWLFPVIFNFEGNKTDEYKKINDELVNTLYENIISDDYHSRYTFYNAYYTKYGNLARDYILKIGYYYLKNNNELKENSLTNDDLIKENIDGKPLNKIDVSTLKKAIQSIFGPDVNISLGDFAIDNKLKGHYVENENKIYIYETDENLEEYYIFRQRESYAISDDQTVVIYDYFVKCNKKTGLCYNDDRMANLNENIKFNNGSINTKNAGNLAKYQHTFKLIDGSYYWYSSELAK